MDAFAEYGHAIASLAGLVVLWGVMNPLSAIKKGRAGAVSGGAPPSSSYSDPAYRWYRAYANLTESVPFFAMALVAAILAGSSPVWVNLLASVFLLIRIAMAVIHVQGIGKPSGGLRSIVFTMGWAISIILAVLAIIAAF